MVTATKKMETKTLVLGAALTALVFLLQMMGAAIRFGTFSISLVLIPIVIGAAACGKAMGAWLGFSFSIAVFASGDASVFWGIDAIGTVITVVAKGTLCGFLAGLTYESMLAVMNRFKNRPSNRYIAVLSAAIVCPIVNTGVFLLGCLVFFWDTMIVWAQEAGMANVATYMIVGFVGINFLIELATNIVLAPVVVRLLNIRKKQL